MNIIFYSRKCMTCQNLLRVLQNENLISYFKLFCVDENMKIVPPEITVVPTMIIANVNKLYVANEIFVWIKQIKFINQNNFLKKNYQKNNSGPIGWVNQEMNGKSDSYAHKDIDKAFSHSYLNVGDELKHAIFTAPETKKITKNEQIQLINNIEFQRNEQDKKYKYFQKEQQLQTIMNIKK